MATSAGILKVMRSYQYYAAHAISDKVAKTDWNNPNRLGGYIWHTTGSGKTMTSFKSAQLIANSKDADIREIRASERRFYQKITYIYALSLDYDSQAPITQEFFATVQNKLHWAITGKTAAETISLNADASKPHMGLSTWKAAPLARMRICGRRISSGTCSWVRSRCFPGFWVPASCRWRCRPERVESIRENPCYRWLKIDLPKLVEERGGEFAKCEQAPVGQCVVSVVAHFLKKWRRGGSNPCFAYGMFVAVRQYPFPLRDTPNSWARICLDRGGCCKLCCKAWLA